MSDVIRPIEDFRYYTPQIYWNSFEIIQEHFNVQISGQRHVGWPQHLLEKWGRRNKALFINCGNGWVERDLYQIGLIREAIGIDIGEAMIKEAVEAAKASGLPARYLVADCNTFAPADMKVDLVVNHAAMHHVAYVNRLSRALSTVLNPGGRYVGFDYVGPHRNQYPWEMWSAVVEFNATLPSHFRAAQLAYPHLKTMLHLDPTEAVHSELQLEVMQRYFDIEQYSPLGGAIAYHILFGNNTLFEARNSEEGRAALQRIVAADQAFALVNPDTSLFAFWAAKPKSTPPSAAEVCQWQAEEDEREARAAAQGGRYYPATPLEMISEQMTPLSSISDYIRALDGRIPAWRHGLRSIWRDARQTIGGLKRKLR